MVRIDFSSTARRYKIAHLTSAHKKIQHNQLYDTLIELSKENVELVLATIIETQGSAPQIPGASALFSPKGLVEGTLGGGILEATAQNKAHAALENGFSEILDFDLTSETMNADAAICGGKVRVLLDAEPHLRLDVFERLCQSRMKRTSGVLATSISQSEQMSVQIKRQWITENEIRQADLGSSLQLFRDELERTLEDDEPRLSNIKKNQSSMERQEWLYLEPIVPLPRLLIAGAGHIGQAVAHLGHLLEFEVTVIDDRSEFANKNRIPDADFFIVDNIPQAVARFPIEQDTYIVIVTRGHSYDTETLRACISSPAAYIGMIGSRRKVNLIRETFLKEAWSTAGEFDRIYTPIGLDIHSKTVEEISVSIAAQLVLIRGEAKKRRGKE